MPKVRASIEACVTVHILNGQIENLERIGTGQLLRFFRGKFCSSAPATPNSFLVPCRTGDAHTGITIQNGMHWFSGQGASLAESLPADGGHHEEAGDKDL